MGELLEIVGQIQLWSQIWPCSVGRFHGSSYPYNYTQISRKVYVSPCLMLPTKFSHNVIFMVPDGSAIMACCSCRFSEPTVFERYKWVTLAVTVTIWPGHTDLMVDRFIVVGSLTLSKSIAGKCSMVTS